MFCGNCGTNVPEGCAFCPNCGAKLVTNEASAPAPAPADPFAQAGYDPAAAYTPAPAETVFITNLPTSRI